jgi:hypothetical protein
VAAQSRFNGPKITRRRTIDDIGLDILDTPYVTFRSGGIFGVQAMFRKDRDEELVGRFSKGQFLVLRCRYRRKLGNVILDHCE